jgi:hypothetical protein
MEADKKEQIFFYIKLLLCTSLIGVWIGCLTMFPESKNYKVKKIVKKIQEIETPKKEVGAGLKPAGTEIQYGDIKLDSSKIVLSTKKTEKKEEPKLVVKKQENLIVKKNIEVGVKPTIAKPLQVAKIAETKVQIKKQPVQTKIANSPKTNIKQAKPIKLPSQALPVKSETSKEIHLANKQEVKNALKNGWQGEKIVKDIKEKLSKPDQKVAVTQKQETQKQETQKPEVQKQENKNEVVKDVKNAEVKPPEKIAEEPSVKNDIAELNFVNLDFPSVAGATRKALESNKEPVKNKEVENSDSPSQLRHKVPVEKNVPASMQSKPTNLAKQEEWVPRYLVAEKKHLEQKLDNLTDDLEKISNQIEVTGFVDNQNGQKSVIIRNTTSNKVEILNKGEKYQGVLRVLDVNNDEVVLGNEELKKTYVKRIAPVE